MVDTGYMAMGSLATLNQEELITSTQYMLSCAWEVKNPGAKSNFLTNPLLDILDDLT